MNKTDRMIEAGGWLLLALLWTFALLGLYAAGDAVPSHFNALGQPDGYSSPGSLLILPVIGTVLFLGIKVLGRYPHVLNYGVEITESNALRQYTMATGLLRVLRFGITAIFLVIEINTYLIITGRAGSLGSWFLPGTIILIWLPIIFYIIQSMRKK